MASPKSKFSLGRAFENMKKHKATNSNGSNHYSELPERSRQTKGEETQVAGKFRYSPLDPTRKQIRILELKMSESEEDIECTLTTTSLHTAANYEALSYTWGSFDNARTILLNGKPFRVTGNLYGALRNLRMKRSVGLIDYFKTHRRFWIDAICIDQEDIEERTCQVLLMWSIYSQASKVVVWLGEEYENSTLGMEMVRLLNLNFELRAKKMVAEILAERDGGKSNAGGSKERGNKEGLIDRREDAQEIGDETALHPRTPRSPQSPRGPQGPTRSGSSRRSRSTSSTRPAPPEGPNGNYSDEDEEKHSDQQVAKDEAPQPSETKRGGGNMNLFWMNERPQVLSDPKDILALTGESSSTGGVSEAAMRRLKPGTTLPDGRRILNEEEQSRVPFDLLLIMHNAPGVPDPKEWISFQKLMERPWWNRIWVVQEVAAAKGLVLVGCGSSWLKWEAFAGAAITVQTYQDHPFFQQLTRFGKGVSAIMDKGKSRIRTDGRLDSFGGLLNLLHDYKDYQATDPRDKVFALLGFTPSIPIKPDYSKTAEEVYEQLVRTSISATGCYMMLYLCRKPSSLHLPSWVPDFSLVMADSHFNNTCPLGFFGADGNNWHNVGVPSAGCTLNPKDIPGHLTVTGFKYDTPLVLGAIWSGTSEERQHNFFSTVAEYQKLLEKIDLEHFPHLTGQHRKESFWRTLIWNATKDDRYPAPADFGKYFDDLLSKQEFLGNLSEPIEAAKMQKVIPRGPAVGYYEAMVRNGFKRRFFITKRGNLGSGPADMQEGDLICVMLGSKAPLILREAIEGNYEFIGQAYVHGIMHGESLRAMSVDQDLQGTRTLGLKPFVLV